MHLPHLPRSAGGGSYPWPGLRFPYIPIRWNFSLSTKLILLVVIPLALTSVVTLPLTMTDLNKLAAVTNIEWLEDEILLVDTHLVAFEHQIEMESIHLTQSPVVMEAVRNSDDGTIKSFLLSSKARMGFQYLQIVDQYGVRLGFWDQSGVALDQKFIDEVESG